MTKFLGALIVSILLGIGCASHHDVRPGADGIHHVVVRSQDKEMAERSAIRQAENFCQESQRHAAFVSEGKTQYTGTMDESTRDTLHKASTAAMVLGGGAGVLGRDNGTQGTGAVVGAAGTAGSIMTGGDDYLSDMKFKCI